MNGEKPIRLKQVSIFNVDSCKANPSFRKNEINNFSPSTQNVISSPYPTNVGFSIQSKSKSKSKSIESSQPTKCGYM